LNLEETMFNQASLVTTYEVDESFDNEKYIKMRLRVCHDGVNPNNSKFTISDIDKARNSLKNIPILAHVINEGDELDFGGHDMALEEDKMNEGEYRIVYKEIPIGIVPESNNYTIEKYNDKNYVYVDCWIFRGYSNYAEDIIERDKDIKLSMEILVDAYYYDDRDKTYQITDFRYKGITLLGKKHGTGMEHAMGTIKSFSTEDIDFMSREVEELIAKLNKGHDSENKVDIYEAQKNVIKEGVDLDEKMKLLEDYNLSVERLDFSIDDLDLEELKVKLEEFKSKAENKDKSAEEDFALTGQLIEELVNNLASIETIESEWGQISRYIFVECDIDKQEVYFWDRNDWKLYGASFMRSGDAVKIDMETKQRMKFAIVPFEGEIDSDFSLRSVFDDILEKATSLLEEKFNALQSEFETYKSQHITPESEVEELRQFKQNKLSEEYEAAVEAIFSIYEEELANNEEFIALKSNYSEMSTEDIEKECDAILGRQVRKQSQTFSKKTNKNIVAPKLPVHTPDRDVQVYGGIFSVYGKTNKN